MIIVFTGVLFLVTISRITNIHIHVNESLQSKPYPAHLNTPWAVVLCGIGAGLAFATALITGLYTWADERDKWVRFDNDVDLTKNEERAEASNERCTNISCENRAYGMDTESSVV